jgi:phospholipid N-methyltransferase
LNQQSVLEITDMGPTFGQLTRANLRKIEFINNNFKILENEEELKQVMNKKSDKKKVFFRYLLDLKEVEG